MLEPVALQHSGFRLPGIYQDGRGVVVGSAALLLVPSVDRLVSVLRLLSEEPMLADLLPSLRAVEVRNQVGARGYLLQFRSSDSRILDRCARAATLCMGTLCVGAERHFIAYRDRRAPLGYDVSALSADGGDYILYTAAAVQPYVQLGELALPRLLARLQLLPRAGGAAAALRHHQAGASSGADELWLLVPLGLLARTVRLLWERGLEVAVALPESLPAPESRPSASPPPTNDGSAVVRLPWSATTVAQLLLLLDAAGPLAVGPRGLRALVPVAQQLAVELGHAHPLNLLPFAELFERGQRHLFLAPSGPSRAASGRPAAAFSPPLHSLPATPFIPAERLIDLTWPAPSGVEPVGATAQRPPARQVAFAPGLSPLRLPLRLQVEPTAAAVPMASLVPWSQIRLLGKLLSLLPPSLFADLRAVALDEGVLLVAPDGSVGSLPVGRPFYSAAPSVLVPFGMALVPRLPGALLRGQLAGSGDGYVVFLPSGAPFSLAAELLVPASLQLISRLEVSRRAAIELPPIESPPQVVNDPVGLLWPLWGRLPAAEAEAEPVALLGHPEDADAPGSGRR